jgi:hypothetical protein
LNIRYGDPAWTLYGYFNDGGTMYYFEEGDDGSRDLSGIDNWVTVTKNDTDNFTVGFKMTIGGDILEGKYRGPFIQYPNYEDVGND